MQPRQRSKCSTTVGLRESVPSPSSPSAGSARGASPSPRARGRTSGRWGGRSRNGRTLVSSSIRREHARRGRTARGARAGAARGSAETPPTRCGTYAMPAEGRTTASPSVEEDVREVARREAGRPSEAPCRPRASSQTAPSTTVPPTSASARSSCDSTAAARPSNSTATRPGWSTSSAPGWSCERRSARTTSAGSALATTSVFDDAGSGWRRRETRAISPSPPSEPQTSLPRS